MESARARVHAPLVGPPPARSASSESHKPFFSGITTRESGERRRLSFGSERPPEKIDEAKRVKVHLSLVRSSILS